MLLSVDCSSPSEYRPEPAQSIATPTDPVPTKLVLPPQDLCILLRVDIPNDIDRVAEEPSDSPSRQKLSLDITALAMVSAASPEVGEAAQEVVGSLIEVARSLVRSAEAGSDISRQVDRARNLLLDATIDDACPIQ
ncbi:MAG: hypothetical protein LC722_06675 [Actinobacteria bacterium]|nr:hypothetical protein [Actinomycetota bacterium]